jgi:hypothetical protein
MPLEQARAAAAAARERRAALIRALASGAITVDDVGRDERAGDVKVVVIAESVPGVGKVVARRTLGTLGVAPSTLWRQLSEAQRAALAEALRAAGSPPAAGP